MKDILRIEKENTIKDFSPGTGTRFLSMITGSQQAHTPVGKYKNNHVWKEKLPIWINKLEKFPFLHTNPTFG